VVWLTILKGLGVDHSQQSSTHAQQRLKLLAETSQDLLHHERPDVFLQRVCERLKQYCQIDFCTSFRLQDAELQLQFSSGLPEQLRPRFERISSGDAAYRLEAVGATPIVVNRIGETGDERTTLVRAAGVRAYCSFPLLYRGELMGTLSFGTRHKDVFSEEELDTIKAVASQAAVAFERFLFISELERRNQELILSNAELRRVNETLEQFARSIAHDLREPVRTVRSYTQLMARKLKDKLDESESVMLDFVEQSTHRLQTMMEGLLAYTAAGRSKPEPFQDVDLNEVVGEVLLNCRALVDANHAVIVVQQLPTVLGDRLELGRVFQNLLVNAIKYRSDLPLQITIGCQRRADQWFIWVEDNGRGIAEKDHRRIFELFQRTASAKGVEGQGIGLAITRRIIERHGGRIWVESEPNRGAKFIFTLPVAPQSGNANAI
jgi:signal transduction histidine kinase